MKSSLLFFLALLVSLSLFEDRTFSEDPPAPHHLILEFSDDGPPALHQVQAKIAHGLNGQWTWVPANISRSENSALYKATVEMPDVGCAVFRVKRLTPCDPDDLKALAPRLCAAGGPIFPLDQAFIQSCTNDDLKDLMGREWYRELVPGVHYAPGHVVVGFADDTDEHDVVALFEAAGVPFNSHFPRMFSVPCVITSGDISHHVRTLEQSAIVLWAQQRGGMLLVQFNVRATMETAERLLSSIEGLQPQWDRINVAPKWGVVEVEPGSEFAWILALETHPWVRYAVVDRLGGPASL